MITSSVCTCAHTKKGNGFAVIRPKYMSILKSGGTGNTVHFVPQNMTTHTLLNTLIPLCADAISI